MTYSISSLNNQEDYKFNITTVDIGDCESILREKYKLNPNDFLFIFKIEYFVDGLLFPIIEYQIYNNKVKKELNIEFCEGIKINMNVPITINENDLYKHDPSNAFYNDICNSHTTKYKTDIIIADRKKEFNNNNMAYASQIVHTKAIIQKQKRYPAKTKQKAHFLYYLK